MAGVWFLVSIPTATFERKLKKCEQLKKRNDKESEDQSESSVRIQIEFYDGDKKVEDYENSLEWHLKDCLEKLSIYEAVWLLSEDKNFYQVFFPGDGFGTECDFVLQTIRSRGIGGKRSSTIGILPCAVFYRERGEECRNKKKYSSNDNGHEPLTTKKKSNGFKAMHKEFIESVTARLTVAQVSEKLRTEGTLSFDFVAFVFIASIIAALGLSENSTVTIVAAMLVSPIMGPLMGFSFGVMTKDKELRRMASRTEIVGLTVCLLTGFIFGFAFGNFSETWGAESWPTPEMVSRGQLRSLWAGSLIALPSGAGVAMSILGGNGAPLVGVAISTSLLPPIVNCGVLWGLSAIKTIRSFNDSRRVVFDVFNNTVRSSLVPPGTYTPTYYPLMDRECAMLGIISLMLTFVNIFCIVISALLVLKIKEVAPFATHESLSRFWRQDVKVAREYNRTLGENEGRELGKHLLKEYAALNGIDSSTLNDDSEHSRLDQLETLKNIVEDAKEDVLFKSISMNVPALVAENVNKRLSIAPGMSITANGPTFGPLNRVGSFSRNSNPFIKRRHSMLPFHRVPLVKDEENIHVVAKKSLMQNKLLPSPEKLYPTWSPKIDIQEMTSFSVSPFEIRTLPSSFRHHEDNKDDCLSDTMHQSQTVSVEVMTLTPRFRRRKDQRDNCFSDTMHQNQSVPFEIRFLPSRSFRRHRNKKDDSVSDNMRQSETIPFEVRTLPPSFRYHRNKKDNCLSADTKTFKKHGQHSMATL